MASNLGLLVPSAFTSQTLKQFCIQLAQCVDQVNYYFQAIERIFCNSCHRDTGPQSIEMWTFSSLCLEFFPLCDRQICDIVKG